MDCKFTKNELFAGAFLTFWPQLKAPPPTAASSKTELFVALGNGRKLITNLAQSCVFDVAEVLVRILQNSYIAQQFFAENQFFAEYNLVPASHFYWLFYHYILLYSLFGNTFLQKLVSHRSQPIDFHSNWQVFYIAWCFTKRYCWSRTNFLTFCKVISFERQDYLS